jgi:hypothetical protein
MSEQDFYAANPTLTDIAYPHGLPDSDAQVVNAARDVITAAEAEATADDPPVREDDEASTEPAATVPLAEAVAESGQVVEAAEAALAQAAGAAADQTDEDAARAEQCARWTSDDQAAEVADDDTEGWQQ